MRVFLATLGTDVVILERKGGSARGLNGAAEVEGFADVAAEVVWEVVREGGEEGGTCCCGRLLQGGPDLRAEGLT